MTQRGWIEIGINQYLKRTVHNITRTQTVTGSIIWDGIATIGGRRVPVYQINHTGNGEPIPNRWIANPD